MTNHAEGAFVIPQALDDSAAGPFGRHVLDKKFRGALEATSKGQK